MSSFASSTTLMVAARAALAFSSRSQARSVSFWTKKLLRRSSYCQRYHALMGTIRRPPYPGSSLAPQNNLFSSLRRSMATSSSSHATNAVLPGMMPGIVSTTSSSSSHVIEEEEEDDDLVVDADITSLYDDDESTSGLKESDSRTAIVPEVVLDEDEEDDDDDEDWDLDFFSEDFDFDEDESDDEDDDFISENYDGSMSSLNALAFESPNLDEQSHKLSMKRKGGINKASPQHRLSFRLSKLISKHAVNLSMSRKEAERLIKTGEVTVAGVIETNANRMMSWSSAQSSIKVKGKLLLLPSSMVANNDNKNNTTKKHPSSSTRSTQQYNPQQITKVWVAHKLVGEVVTEFDPHGRPSIIERLKKGGVGRRRRGRQSAVGNSEHTASIAADHLKTVGRLDMMTEGLILITNDGQYKREMELPNNGLHRTYRARIHGKLTPYKLKALRKGMYIDGVFYKGMQVQIEDINRRRANRRRKQQMVATSTNTWIRLTCVEGKNRMVRKVLHHLGLTVNRLIRISYGDYELGKIRPGMAMFVKAKPLKSHKRRGPLEALIRRQEEKDIREGSPLVRSVKGALTLPGSKARDNDEDESNETAAPVEWVTVQSSLR